MSFTSAENQIKNGHPPGWVGTFRFSMKYNGKNRKASGSMNGAQGDLKGSRENDTSFFNEKNIQTQKTYCSSFLVGSEILQ